MGKLDRQLKFYFVVFVIIIVVPVIIAKGIFEVFGGGVCMALAFVLVLVLILLNRNNQKIIYRDGWSIEGVIDRITEIDLMSAAELEQLKLTDLDGYGTEDEWNPNFDQEAVLGKWSSENWWDKLSVGLVFEVGSRVDLNVDGTYYRGTVIATRGLLHDIEMDSDRKITGGVIPPQIDIHLRGLYSSESGPSEIEVKEKDGWVGYRSPSEFVEEENWWEDEKQ